MEKLAYRENITKIVNEFGESIVQVTGDIPVDLPAQAGDRFLFISHAQRFLTHALHKYPAKFFPELPRWLIKRYSEENERVLDPFSGSGTTNVEALLARRHSVGIDVDPFSRFVARVKVTPLAEDELRAARRALLDAVLNYRPSLVDEAELPDFPYRDNWFNKEILWEMSYLKKEIDSLGVSEAVKDFFRLCFSSIIRAVSNADDNCTRTVIRKKLNKLVRPGDALNRFAKTVLDKVPKMVAFSQTYPHGITAEFPADMDARHISYAEDSFEFALTSPPYVNAVDYPRTHQLEMYWLGFAQNSLTEDCTKSACRKRTLSSPASLKTTRGGRSSPSNTLWICGRTSPKFTRFCAQAADTLLSSGTIASADGCLRIGSISCLWLKRLGLRLKLTSVRRLSSTLSKHRGGNVSILTGCWF